MPSSSSAGNSPSVGPVPEGEVVTTSLPVESPVVVSPSESCVKPVRITSPVKIPVSVPVSTSL